MSKRGNCYILISDARHIGLLLRPSTRDRRGHRRRHIVSGSHVAALAGVGFIWRSLSHPQPIVDFSALKIRNFGLGSLFSFVSGIAIFTTIYLTPLFLGRVRGFSALQIGFAVFSTGRQPIDSV